MDPLVTLQTHHASSGLSTCAQAVPSDKTHSLPILHPTPIHPSKPQSGVSTETAVSPTPTPAGQAPLGCFRAPASGEAI